MFVDRKSEDLLSDLRSATFCKKHGTVKARRAKSGEKVSTLLADGTAELEENVAKRGDWVITNPGGEQYIISAETFSARYESTATKGVYAAKGYIRAMPNPFGVAIEMVTSGGMNQHDDKFCFIACVCDEYGNLNGEPYLIGYAEFQQTYSPVV